MLLAPSALRSVQPPLKHLVSLSRSPTCEEGACDTRHVRVPAITDRAAEYCARGDGAGSVPEPARDVEPAPITEQEAGEYRKQDESNERDGGPGDCLPNAKDTARHHDQNQPIREGLHINGHPILEKTIGH